MKRADIIAIIQRLRFGAELHGMPVEAIEIMRGTADDLERMLNASKDKRDANAS